jgi:agmatinase
VNDDAHSSPETSPARYSGIRTFARLAHDPAGEGADVAVVGAPFDGGTSFRPGARFGPEAIRSASMLLRPYDPVLEVDTLRALSVVDAGDVAPSPGSTEQAIAGIAEGLSTVVEAGAITLVLGGDHTIALAELRALAARHGPPALVLLDSHPDTWDTYGDERYFHGTPFRRAAEEGVVDPSRSVMAGMRGTLYRREDWDDAEELGFDLIPGSELRGIGAQDYGRRVRERVGDGPALLSFDIDFVDPGFAPATGTPEPGGPTSAEALDLVRALTGINFVGFDVVEVSPPYDSPGQPTSLLAATVAHTMLGLVALSRS